MENRYHQGNATKLILQFSSLMTMINKRNRLNEQKRFSIPRVFCMPTTTLAK